MPPVCASSPCRGQYRLNDFNPSFSAFLRELALKKPVVCTGDLNVATFDEVRGEGGRQADHHLAAAELVKSPSS